MRRRRIRRGASAELGASNETTPDDNSLRFRRTDVEEDAGENVVDNRTTVTLAEFEMAAVLNRLLDEVNGEGRSLLAQDLHAPSVYHGRLPPHGRHRVRVYNSYYIAGPRRQHRHSHLSTELERELLRSNFRALRFTTDVENVQNYDYAASEDQIEALPTFVMEKGEKRSVRQIFATMGYGKGCDAGSDAGGDGDAVDTDDFDDSCGGLMTSYTECAICLSGFEPGDEITLLPCGHFFHLTGCVREWLRNHARTCPTCRADICTTTASSDGLASQSATVATSEDIS